MCIGDTCKEFYFFGNIIIKVDSGIDPLQCSTKCNTFLVEVTNRGKVACFLSSTCKAECMIHQVARLRNGIYPVSIVTVIMIPVWIIRVIIEFTHGSCIQRCTRPVHECFWYERGVLITIKQWQGFWHQRYRTFESIVYGWLTNL